MDAKLDNLIEKLKKEGVEGGNEAAEKIVAAAKKKADSIISDARQEAEQIVQAAEKEKGQLEERAELGIQQAVRDSLLKLREEIDNLIERVFKANVGEELTPEYMADLIKRIIDKWAEKPDMDIMINESDKEKLEKQLSKLLKKEASDGITLTPDSSVAQGFRISEKGNDFYYDFTEESIAQLLKSSLNERIAKILDKK